MRHNKNRNKSPMKRNQKETLDEHDLLIETRLCGKEGRSYHAWDGVDCDCYVLFFLVFGLVRSIKMTGTLDPNGLQADISASYCNNERTNCLCADRIFSFLPVASSNSCPFSLQPNGKSPVRTFHIRRRSAISQKDWCLSFRWLSAVEVQLACKSGQCKSSSMVARLWRSLRR